MRNSSNNLYIILSATPLKMGKFIRKVTKYQYNHVSISIDNELKEFYSFARHHKNTPFYGGFIKESSLRYKDSVVNIYRIEISNKNYNKLKKHFNSLWKDKNNYVYNMYSAGLYIVKKKVKLKKAYTCIEIVTNILENYTKIEIDNNKFYQVKDIEKLLKDKNFYKGNLTIDKNQTWNEDKYLEKQNLKENIKKTIYNNLKLSKMLFERKK